MQTATIHQAKTHLLRLIEQAQRGEEIIIARGKTPVARLVPIEPPKKERNLAILKGMQAQAENLFLVSNERAFDNYGVNRVW